MRLWIARCLLVGACLSAAAPASAQSKPTPTPSKDPAPSKDPKVEEARKRYNAGLKLYEDGNYEAARIEFERAMELAPSYRIYYNVALAYKQLNNYVSALKAFQLYLDKGGIEVEDKRRAEVEKEMAELRPRIAKLTIKTNVAGADVSIDDVAVGKSPLPEPVQVNPGVRKVSASAKGRFPATKSITVGGSESINVDLDLAEPATRVVERKTNPWMVPTIVGWSATGAATISTVIFGALALHAKSQQEDLNKTFASTSAQRDDARDKTTTLSGASDILLITSVVFAGASAYFTYRLLTNKTEHTEVKTGGASDSNFDLRFGPRGVAAIGTF